MFNHDGKTASVIGNARVRTYKELYLMLTELQKNGELETHNDYLGGNELAETIYQKKYYLKNPEFQ